MEFVYAVYYNSDMTEGRGPFILDRIFRNEENAREYADSQLGIMGREPPEGGWPHGNGADWQVRRFILY